MSYKAMNEVKNLLKVKEVKQSIMDKVTPETYWGMLDKTQIKIKHMGDTHLLNTIEYLSHRIKTKEKVIYPEQLKHWKEIVKCMKKVALDRGLDFSNIKQKPFLDNDGQMKIWDHKKGKPVTYIEKKNKNAK